MIYEFKNDLIFLCKNIRHFFRALICRDYYTESHGLGMCGKYGTNLFKARFCDYRWCPKRKGADDSENPNNCEEQTKTKTETQNSNKNSNVISVYDGVSEAVRCAICSNPNKSDRGCDGACSYDEKLYERIMKAIAESIVKDEPQTFDKLIECLGCLYSDLDKVFHPCASCEDFSEYVGEVSGKTES